MKPAASAVFLGLLTSFFWAFQHPLQNPVYSTAADLQYGRIAIVIIAEILACFFVSITLISRRVRIGVKAALGSENATAVYSRSVPVSVLGLLFYAFGLSNLDGPSVSISISLSPLAALFFAYIVNEDSVSSSLRNGLRSKEFRAHMLAIVAVIVVVATNGLIGSAGISQATAHFWESVASSGLFVLLSMMVPFCYFYSGSTVAKEYKKQGGFVHFGAVVVAFFLAAVLSIVALGSFIALSGKGVPSLTSDLPPLHVAYFVSGAFLAAFLGTLVLHLSYRLPSEVQGIPSVTYHSVPVFTFAISFSASALDNRGDFPWSATSLISSIAVAGVAVFVYRYELKEFFLERS